MLERVFSEMDRHLYKLLSAIKIEMLNIFTIYFALHRSWRSSDSIHFPIFELKMKAQQACVRCMINFCLSLAWVEKEEEKKTVSILFIFTESIAMALGYDLELFQTYFKESLFECIIHLSLGD